jgi:hypothetical protein
MQHFHDLLPIGTLPFAPSQSLATGPIRRGCLLLVEFRLTVVSLSRGNYYAVLAWLYTVQ